MAELWLVDAFTEVAFTGNPAGVVPDADNLTDAQMQAIASEVHASETAFLLRPTRSDADLRVRFFTPACEVDLCGHATIGSICATALEGRLPHLATPGKVRLETNVGVLPVCVRIDGGRPFAEMTQTPPAFRDVDLPIGELEAWLGVDTADIDPDWPAGLAYTGMWDLFVPIRTRIAMAKMQPDLAALARFNRSLGVASTHVYTTECVDAKHDFHARDFSPAVGISEDPATGTATGALTALLHHHGRIAAGQTYRFEQGYEIGRDSVIHSRIDVSSGKPRVYVGGTARISMRGQLSL